MTGWKLLICLRSGKTAEEEEEEEEEECIRYTPLAEQIFRRWIHRKQVPIASVRDCNASGAFGTEPKRQKDDLNSTVAPMKKGPKERTQNPARKRKHTLI
jgi:hypothetical protein